jgi:hypothetical protein
MEKSNKILIGTLVASTLVGIGVGVYFLTKKPKALDKNDSEKENEQKTSSDVKPKSEEPKSEELKTQLENPKVESNSKKEIDFTKPISIASPFDMTKANSVGNKYNLGQNVIVKKGMSIRRLDKKGENQGLTNTDKRLALGILWHINPNGTNVVVKSKSGFAYPFYIVNINSFE